MESFSGKTRCSVDHAALLAGTCCRCAGRTAYTDNYASVDGKGVLVAVEALFGSIRTTRKDQTTVDCDCAIGVHTIVVRRIEISLSAVDYNCRSSVNAIIDRFHFDNTPIDCEPCLTLKTFTAFGFAGCDDVAVVDGHIAFALDNFRVCIVGIHTAATDEESCALSSSSDCRRMVGIADVERQIGCYGFACSTFAKASDIAVDYIYVGIRLDASSRIRVGHVADIGVGCAVTAGGHVDCAAGYVDIRVGGNAFTTLTTICDGDVAAGDIDGCFRLDCSAI